MAKQTEIPGTEAKVIKEVSDAAEAYRVVRNKRMRASKKEKEGKDALIAAMGKHKLHVYRDPNASPPFTVTLSEGKAVVKVADEDGTGADDEGEDEE